MIPILTTGRPVQNIICLTLGLRLQVVPSLTIIPRIPHHRKRLQSPATNIDEILL
jgi:hypothetical protein